MVRKVFQTLEPLVTAGDSLFVQLLCGIYPQQMIQDASLAAVNSKVDFLFVHPIAQQSSLLATFEIDFFVCFEGVWLCMSQSFIRFAIWQNRYYHSRMWYPLLLSGTGRQLIHKCMHFMITHAGYIGQHGMAATTTLYQYLGSRTLHWACTFMTSCWSTLLNQSTVQETC